MRATSTYECHVCNHIVQTGDEVYLVGGDLRCEKCAPPSCHYCATTERDLRPYGPGGSWVCFSCATETPEREAQAQSAFGALLDGSAAISPTGIVAIGETSGPRPFDPKEVN